jgi:hypothetical protein
VPRSSGSSGGRGQIYVETRIRSSLERLWELSQDPGLHPRWDLRFSRIVPTGLTPEGHALFRYEFRLPFHTIRGSGTSLGTRSQPDGQSTSVLKFSTSDPLSPIGPGAGYWRYIPTKDGVRFITGYNYRPGMGRLGRTLDRRVSRPALGWATAWSFDRLRLWAESDVDPGRSRNAWILDSILRLAGFLTGSTLVARATSATVPVNQGDTRRLLGFALVAAAVVVPSPPIVPRARRCLRRPPDSRSAVEPASLAKLAEPEGYFLPLDSENGSAA